MFSQVAPNIVCRQKVKNSPTVYDDDTSKNNDDNDHGRNDDDSDEHHHHYCHYHHYHDDSDSKMPFLLIIFQGYIGNKGWLGS